MTDFQTKCIAACQRFFQGLRLDLRFREELEKRRLFNLGRREKFFVGKVALGPHAIEVFVYVDEAGFMVDDKRWYICERPDFDSDEQLIEELMGILLKCISELPQLGA